MWGSRADCCRCGGAAGVRSACVGAAGVTAAGAGVRWELWGVKVKWEGSRGAICIGGGRGDGWSGSSSCMCEGGCSQSQRFGGGWGEAGVRAGVGPI